MKQLLLGTSAAVLLATSLPASAQSVIFGRLFATPIERGNMDVQRAGTTAGAAPGMAGMAGQAQPNTPAAPPAPEPIELNGVVRRSSGRSTTWLNQVPQTDASNQILPGQTVQLRLNSGRKVLLKPGQTFNPADGSVQEAQQP